MESFYSQNNPEETLKILNSNVVKCLKRCALLETVCISNDKPKINLKDNSFISKFFNSKRIGRDKRNIINDTRNSKKSTKKITLLKIHLLKQYIYNFKMANLLNYKFFRLGCSFSRTKLTKT